MVGIIVLYRDKEIKLKQNGQNSNDCNSKLLCYNNYSVCVSMQSVELDLVETKEVGEIVEETRPKRKFLQNIVWGHERFYWDD